MALITILTPTFNRAEKLCQLFNSLKEQSIHDFKWLIVDDGSTDNTREVVKKFFEQRDIEVKYLYKKNGGKHTALNAGILKISTPLTIIVDSDDVLLPEAIETIKRFYIKYTGIDNICGFGFLKVDGNENVLVNLPKEEFIQSHIECRIRKNLPGDIAEVLYTDILKKFHFPEFKGEKFISEDIVWITMGNEYSMVFIKRPIYKCEYLVDGLTKNDKPMKFASPLGSMLRGKKLMTKSCGIVSWFRGAIIYNCYKREIKKNYIPEILKITDIRSKLIIRITSPIGTFYNWYWKR